MASSPSGRRRDGCDVLAGHLFHGRVHLVAMYGTPPSVDDSPPSTRPIGAMSTMRSQNWGRAKNGAGHLTREPARAQRVHAHTSAGPADCDGSAWGDDRGLGAPGHAHVAIRAGHSVVVAGRRWRAEGGTAGDGWNGGAGIDDDRLAEGAGRPSRSAAVDTGHLYCHTAISTKSALGHCALSLRATFNQGGDK